MSKYIATALEIVRILGLENTDENILKYVELVKTKSVAEKDIESMLERDFNKGLK